MKFKLHPFFIENMIHTTLKGYVLSQIFYFTKLILALIYLKTQVFPMVYFFFTDHKNFD